MTKVESNAGGGGERVLWTAIAAMQRTDRTVVSIVYTGDTDASKEQIIAKVKVSEKLARTASRFSHCFRLDLISHLILHSSISSSLTHAVW